jgi:hypothetical protein
MNIECSLRSPPDLVATSYFIIIPNTDALTLNLWNFKSEVKTEVYTKSILSIDDP